MPLHHGITIEVMQVGPIITLAAFHATAVAS
jgi:hypothetical protein